MNELEIIIVEVGDITEGARHNGSHPHIVHIYSEADEEDHAFRVKDNTVVGHIFDEFYRKTGLTAASIDLFKCEASGEDLSPHRMDTIAKLREATCRQLVWVFTNREIDIIVNGQKKTVAKRALSFSEIVALAFETPPAGQNVIFTVTYRKGPEPKPAGTLIPGESVHIKEGMIFNVTATDKS